ncbi:hypothetical protein [Streptomyces sp. NPDC046759]|uniref:hypothetical protein n=1 Tax=Streptomyces sp. NPDC046759 TaxID=3155019 RepID=UPI00340AB1C5
MTAEREPEPGRDTNPVPRDMPDQQAGAGEDPWEAGPDEQPEDDASPAPDAPDADEPSA